MQDRNYLAAPEPKPVSPVASKLKKLALWYGSSLILSGVLVGLIWIQASAEAHQYGDSGAAWLLLPFFLIIPGLAFWWLVSSLWVIDRHLREKKQQSRNKAPLA